MTGLCSQSTVHSFRWLRFHDLDFLLQCFRLIRIEKCHPNGRDVPLLQQDWLLNGSVALRRASDVEVVDFASEELTHLNERHEVWERGWEREWEPTYLVPSRCRETSRRRKGLCWCERAERLRTAQWSSEQGGREWCSWNGECAWILPGSPLYTVFLLMFKERCLI